MVEHARCRQSIPNALCHKWHHRMQETHRHVQYKYKVSLNLKALFSVSVQKPRLAKLNIPVTDIVPEKCLDVAGIIAKTVGLKLFCRLRSHTGKAREHPGILRRLRLRLPRCIAFKVHLHKPACIPDFCHKGASLIGSWRLKKLLGFLIQNRIKLDVLIVGNKRQQVITHSIGAVLGNEIHGIDAIALGL